MTLRTNIYIFIVVGMTTACGPCQGRNDAPPPRQAMPFDQGSSLQDLGPAAGSKPGHCTRIIENTAPGVWSICQERRWGTTSVAETVLVRQAAKPDGAPLPHQRLAGARAWSVLGLSALRLKQKESATACFRAGIHELADSYEGGPKLDELGYNDPGLKPITHSDRSLSDMEIDEISRMLTYRINSYITKHGQGLAEELWYIHEPCDYGDCDLVLILSNHPGLITFVGALPFDAWPLVSPFLSIDIQTIRTVDDNQRIYKRYIKSNSYAEFLNDFRHDGYKLWGLNEK